VVGLALIEAARSGDASRVRQLLAAGADPNLRAGNDRFDHPPLAYAVEANAIECAQVLISAGAEVNAHLGYGSIAARATNLAMLRVLLDSGADTSWQDSGFGLCHYLAAGDASVEDRGEMIRELRRRGVDIDHQERFPNLWVAAQSGNADAVDALLRGGADPQVRPNPLGGAVWGAGGGDQETTRVIDLLVAAGCDLQVRDEHGLGLMHGALMPYSHGVGFESSDGMNVEAVRALLRHGLTIEVTFPDGRRPLHVAAEEPDSEIVVELVRAGARVDDRTPDGATAFDLALARRSAFETWAAEREGAEPGSSDARFRETLLSIAIPAASRCIELLQAGLE
jgi:ankyrin repeat protein